MSGVAVVERGSNRVMAQQSCLGTVHAVYRPLHLYYVTCHYAGKCHDRKEETCHCIRHVCSFVNTPDYPPSFASVNISKLGIAINWCYFVRNTTPVGNIRLPRTGISRASNARPYALETPPDLHDSLWDFNLDQLDWSKYQRLCCFELL